MGDHAVGAEQLGAGEAVGHGRRVDGLAGGAYRRGDLEVATTRRRQFLPAEVDRAQRFLLFNTLILAPSIT